MVGRAENLRIGNSAQQIADQAVEFTVSDQVRGLLIAQSTAEHAREPHQRIAAARQTVGLVTGADQLALNTECGGLQWDKGDVFEGGTIHSLAKAKHEW